MITEGRFKKGGQNKAPKMPRPPRPKPTPKPRNKRMRIEFKIEGWVVGDKFLCTELMKRGVLMHSSPSKESYARNWGKNTKPVKATIKVIIEEKP